jgi:hypothetical protein
VADCPPTCIPDLSTEAGQILLGFSVVIDDIAIAELNIQYPLSYIYKLFRDRRSIVEVE